MTKSGMVYQPVDYVSHVTVTGKDGVPKHMTVRVNHPIDVDGTLYYQASYGFGMKFDVSRGGRRDAALSNRTFLEGDSLDLPGTQRSLLYERFAPTIDKQSGMPTADPRVNDPGVVLGASQAGSALGEGARAARQAARRRRRLARYAEAVRALQRLPIPLRSGRSAGRNRRIRAAGGLDYLVLLSAGSPLPARRPGCAGPRSRVGAAATTVKGYDVFASRVRPAGSDLTQRNRPRAAIE